MSRPDIDLELKTVASTSISCNHYKNNIGEIFKIVVNPVYIVGRREPIFKLPLYNLFLSIIYI
jgi:hypothetical protein